MGNKGYDTVIRAVKVALMGLTLLSFAKAIWISLDIDESYAVACAYRMTRGTGWSEICGNLINSARF